LAAVAAWYTLLLLPLTTRPRVSRWWHESSRERVARRLGELLFASALLVIAAEASLQTWKIARQHGWLAGRSGSSSFEEGLDVAALVRGAQDGHRPRPPLRAGPLRVAVLTDRPAASLGSPGGYLARVEHSLPGVKIVPVRLDKPWSSQPAGELAEQLSAVRADLVLAMLSVCEDVTRDVPQRSWFDWRQFELARLVQASSGPSTSVAPGFSAAPTDFESLCRTLAPQLAACRTPIDESMRGRWRQTLGALDDLVADCRQRDLPVAVVLVPGEFQVNGALCDTLARRSGYKAEQVDVELPQRKLACFAAKRQLPLIDLLPSLRLCGQPPYERNALEWNDAGHSAAAGAIGGWLESRYGPQLSVDAQLTSAP
jgi:hypothetical protein